MTPQSPQYAAKVAIGIIAAGLACLQCTLPSTSKTNASVPGRPLAWRFQCPEEGVMIWGIDTIGGIQTVADSVLTIPLSQPITNIPEYHDCQRFIDSSGHYGSVYAIFAAFLLDTVSGGQSTPVATIYTPDGTYSPLGIMPGFSCLLLAKSGDTWTATMVAQGQNHSDCTQPVGQSTTLYVRQQQINSTTAFESSAFPPAARWDWDSVNLHQYIGIRCGAAWCEVGPQGFVSSGGYRDTLLQFDPIPNLPIPPQATERVQRIKGWYDEQRLAQAGGAGPSTVHAFLIPHPALDMINWPPSTPLPYYVDRWVHVAYAILDKDYHKWNLKKGVNKISFCYGTSADTSCKAMAGPQDEGSSVQLNLCPPDPTSTARRWWAKTESHDGITYTCVKRIDHLSQLQSLNVLKPGLQYRIPGTARWKFVPLDESTWMSCPTGCCTKQ